MSAVFLATATVRLGQTTTDKDGNVIKHTKPSCEFDPAGGSVIVGKLKITDVGMEQDGAASVFADWDAAQYFPEALRLLEPKRETNIPDFEKIVKTMARSHGDKVCPFFDACESAMCYNCIVNEWFSEVEDEG